MNDLKEDSNKQLKEVRSHSNPGLESQELHGKGPQGYRDSGKKNKTKNQTTRNIGNEKRQ
jgi:hypothetical protein